ncbi:MAG TPA: hypothetical protein ENJ80_14170 [Gammaproteobacteria bacterium]|nr:hypothetical protein [Gammaproteobacteria bacterium]
MALLQGALIDLGYKLPLIEESVEIKDAFMGDFHCQGLAKEYNEIGSFSKTFVWKHGEAIPAGQITPKSR